MSIWSIFEKKSLSFENFKNVDTRVKLLPPIYFVSNLEAVTGLLACNQRNHN